MFGCDREPEPERAADEIAAARTAVQESLRSVVAIAEAAGLTVREATGAWSVCSPEPPKLSYRAGGTAAPTDTPAAETIASLTAALEDDGWQVESADTEPRPYAVLTRDGLRASVGVSRALATKGRVGMSVTGDCVATTRDQSGELLGERDTVIG